MLKIVDRKSFYGTRYTFSDSCSSDHPRTPPSMLLRIADRAHTIPPAVHSSHSPKTPFLIGFTTRCSRSKECKSTRISHSSAVAGKKCQGSILARGGGGIMHLISGRGSRGNVDSKRAIPVPPVFDLMMARTGSGVNTVWSSSVLPDACICMYPFSGNNCSDMPI